MKRSLSEIGATIARAARGAGYPPGQAEDLGRVAAYLAGISGDLGLLTAALQEPQTALRADWLADRVIIHAGPAILVAPLACDALAAGLDQVQLAEPAHAPLVTAMLALCGLTPWWDGPVLRRGDCEILPPQPGPAEVDEADWQLWQAHAACTYVPDSAASRSAGAGAGAIDND